MFQVLHPAKVQDQLGRHLLLIDGDAGAPKTIREGVQQVRVHIAAGTRVLCDAPTVLARQNLVRALHDAFPGKVRVVGHSRLSELELTLTLEARIGSDMAESPLAMFTLCKDFNNKVAQYLSNVGEYLWAVRSGQKSDQTAERSLMSPEHSQCFVCHQHDEFIKARENLEAIECMTRQESIASTPIVCVGHPAFS